MLFVKLNGRVWPVSMVTIFWLLIHL